MALVVNGFLPSFFFHPNAIVLELEIGLSAGARTRAYASETSRVLELESSRSIASD